MTRAYRHWTTGDVRRLLEWKRAGLSHQEVAERLGRSRGDVCRYWRLYGEAKPRPRFTPAEFARLRELNAQGYSDPDIAKEMGRALYTVHGHRQALGLPSNRFNERHRAKAREAYHRACRNSGVGRLGHVAGQARAVAAARLGWPGARSPEQARTLSSLEAGPLTMWDLAARRGVSVRAVGHVLAGLRLLGLVVRAGKVPGPHGLRGLYALAPGVARHAPTREKGEPGPHKLYEVRKPKGKEVRA